jgi:outer membrane protein assembly factor BamB
MAIDHPEAERLHQFLDAQAQGVPDDFVRLDPALVTTFQRLKALNAQAMVGDARSTPDPQLEDQLWRNLMSDVSLSAPTPASAPITRLHDGRQGWDRKLTFQALAVAALLIALIGSLALGPRSATDGRTGVISPPALHGDQARGAAMFQQNPARTGVSVDAGPMTEPRVLWRATLQQTSFAGLQPKFAVDGTLFLVDQDAGSVQAMSVETGAVLWTSSLDLPPVVGNDQVAGEGLIIASTGQNEDGTGTIVAIDQKTGQEIWRVDNLGAFQGAPLIDNGKLIFISTDRMLRIVDARTGVEDWHLDIAAMSIAAISGTPFPVATSGLQYDSTVAVANGLAYISAGDGVLYAIDLKTKELAWFLKTDGNAVRTPAIVDGDLYFVAALINPDPTVTDAKEGSTLYKLDAKTGDVEWKEASTRELRLDAVLKEHLVADSTLFRTDTGEIAGAVPEGAINPVYSADIVYWLDQNGQMNAARYNASNGTFTPLWAVYLGVEAYRPPILADGVLISRGPDNTVVALGGNAIATPEAGSTPDADAPPTDLSGLAACIAPPPVDWRNVEGEPAHTLHTYTEQIVDGTPQPIDPGYLSQPWFDYDNVPTGTPASAEVIAGIQQTIKDARVCARPGNQVDDSGFFSVDYYRRPWVQDKLAQRPEAPMLSIFSDLVVDWLPLVETAIVLDDGRVGVLLDPAPPMVDNFALYFVFVPQDGYWVVDEVIRVGSGALQG